MLEEVVELENDGVVRELTKRSGESKDSYLTQARFNQKHKLNMQKEEIQNHPNKTFFDNEKKRIEYKQIKPKFVDFDYGTHSKSKIN